jgi:hypothetical protein
VDQDQPGVGVFLCKTGTEISTRYGLAHSTFLIDDGNDHVEPAYLYKQIFAR